MLTLAVYAAEDLFHHIKRLHWMWWPALGGLAVGIGGYFEPRALGVGFAAAARATRATRADRPDERSGSPAACPFCWGNEDMTPPEVLRVPAGAGVLEAGTVVEAEAR